MSELSQSHDDTNSSRTTISLSKKNYDKLKNLGFAGETFDTVIGRQLEKVEVEVEDN